MSSTEPLLRRAIENNRAWCHFVAQQHNIDATQNNEYWQARSNMPTFFPNLVTLTQGSHAKNSIPRKGSYFIKDSFAELDLSGENFLLLFDATWYANHNQAIARQTDNTCLIEQASDRQSLHEWEARWRGEENFDPIYPTAFIDQDPVAFWTVKKNEKIAGITSFFDGQSLGIYNLWGNSELHSALLAHLQSRYPNTAIVGYGDSDELHQLTPFGFESLGAVKVWGRFE